LEKWDSESFNESAVRYRVWGEEGCGGILFRIENQAVTKKSLGNALPTPAIKADLGKSLRNAEDR
jgi:hypothetical protein